MRELCHQGRKSTRTWNRMERSYRGQKQMKEYMLGGLILEGRYPMKEEAEIPMTNN